MWIDILYFAAIFTIWFSVLTTVVTLAGGVTFIIKQLRRPPLTQLTPLSRYPLVTLVVPAHNEQIVISDTVRSILNLNYPTQRLEILIYADNCQDQTANRVRQLMQSSEYRGRNLRVIERTGSGGKAGVLNDALKVAHGEYLGVYDADAAPEKNALYFLVKKVLENPERYAAAYGRNKTRNYKQDFLTRCINLEIVNTQRIQHTGLWQLFKIGRIPGTNFIINTNVVKKIGGWNNGALTEDTAISFSIMEQGQLIALAHQAEAFQQEPESLSAYYNQRKRWARGNYDVIVANFHHLFDRSPWRIKLEVSYYVCTFFWFFLAIIVSNGLFIFNIGTITLSSIFPHIQDPLAISTNLSILFAINWVLMFYLYVLQICIATASDYGQGTAVNFWYAVVSYFSYSQLFIVVSFVAIVGLLADKIRGKETTTWYKTQRFNE